MNTRIQSSARKTARQILTGRIAAACAVALTAHSAQAASGTWLNTGPANANWNTGTNWVSGTIPGDTVPITGTNANADIATFNTAIGANNYGTTATPILIDSTSENLSGINFDLAAGNYFIGATAGSNSLFMSSGGAIQILNTLTATNAIETFNAPIVIEGASGTYSFTNNSANGTGVGAGTLKFLGGITGGAAGATVLTLNGSNTNANTISGIMANGSATTLGITKSDAGTWVLSGANTYTGATTISGGTLKAGVASVANVSGAFGKNSAVSLANTSGALMEITGFATQIGSLTGGGTTGGNVTLGAATLTVGGDNTSPAAYAGIISGTGGLTKIGSGTQILSGANTYTGTTLVSAGTLNVTGSHPPSATTGSVFQVNGGSLSFNMGADTATYYGDGFGVAPQIGYGATGTMTVQSGTVNVLTKTGGSFGSINLGVSSATSNGTINVTGGTLNVEGRILMAANGAAGTQSTLTIGGGQVTLGKAGSYINGANDPGCGVLWFGSYKSTVTLNTNGTLALFGMRTTAPSGTQGSFNFNGGTLKAVATNNTDFFKLNTGMAAVVMINGAIIDTSTFNVTIGTVLTHDTSLTGVDGGLTKQGSGTLTLSVANTYTGLTNVTAGTLAYSINNVVLAGGVTVNGATAILDLKTFTDSVGTVTVDGGGAIINSSTAGVLTSTGTFEMKSGSVGASLAGTSIVLNKTTVGTVTLTGTNTYTGATQVTGGTLTLSGTGAINSSSGITINGSGAKFLQTSSVTSTPAITLTQGTLDGTTSVGDITVGSGTGGIVANGNLASNTILTLASLNFTGAGTVSLRLAGGAATSPGGSPGLTVTGALTTSGTVTVNLTPTAPLANGSTYNLIGYGSYPVANTNFALGTSTGLSGRQSGTFGNTGTGAGFITLAVAGDLPVWTGLNGGQWLQYAVNTPTTATPAFALETAHTATDFWIGDIVKFNDTYDLGAGPVAVTGTTITIQGGNVSPTAVTFNNSALNYILTSGDGSGIAAGSLTKNGSGTLTINNTNSFTGGTIITAGTLILGHATDTLANTGAVTVDGATAVLSIGGNSDTVGAVSLKNGASITGTGGVLTGSSYAVESGSISAILGGAGTLTKSTVGIVTWTGANTYTGTTIINQGNLIISGSGVIANTPTNGITINNTGTLTLSRSDTWGASSAATPLIPITLNAGGVMTNGGAFFNALGALNLNGGTLTSTGGNGALSGLFDSWALKGTVTVGGSVASTISQSGTNANINLGGGSVTGTTFDVADATGNANTDLLVSAVLQNGANAGNVAQASSLTKTGVGTMTLSGANTYSGDTTITQGTLQVGALGTIPNGAGKGNVVFTTAGNTATFDINGFDTTINGLTAGGSTTNKVVNNATFTAKTLSVGNNDATSTFAGIIADNTGTGGTLALTKQGSGTLTLSSYLNSFTGNLTITQGTVVAGAGANETGPNHSALGNPLTSGRKIIVGSGAFLTFAGNDVLGNAGSFPLVTLEINGGTVNNNGAFFNTLGPVTLNGGTLTGSGGPAGAYQTYQLHGDVTVTGSTASTISATGSNNGVHLNTTTTFDVADVTGNANTDLTVSAPLINQSGSLAAAGLTKSGVGTMVLSAANTYTGGTSIGTPAAGVPLVTSATANGGTLVAGSAGALGGTASIAVNNGGTLLLAGAGSIDRLNNAAGITLGTTGATAGSVGGTISTAGLTGASEIMGSLTLSSSSTLDFGNTSNGGNTGNTLRFLSLAGVTGQTGGSFSLTVNNWSGNYYAIGATSDPNNNASQDRLLFTNDPGFGLGTEINSISFYNDTGGFIGHGEQVSFSGGGFEIVAVPEPATIFGAFGLVALVGFRERRRLLGFKRG